MADIFISYSHLDKDIARGLAKRLEEAEWSIWIDDRLEGGKPFDAQIEAALEAARLVVVVWSKTAGKSDWVIGEAREALKTKKLLPVRLDASDPSKLPLDLRSLHVVDLSSFRPGEPHSGVDILLQQIAVRLGRTEAQREDDDARAMRRMRKRVREAGVTTLLAGALAFAAIVCLAAGVPGWIPRMRLFSLQALHATAPLEANDALRVVLIDKQAEEALWNERVGPARDGASGEAHAAGVFGPMWRYLHARAIDRLTAAGAKVIAFDVGFSDGSHAEGDPRRLADLELARAIRDARAKGTALFALATQRDAQGALVVQSDIGAALKSNAPGLGSLTHGCMGYQEGWATLVPLLLAGDEPLYSLGLTSVAAFAGTTPAWDRQAQRLTRVSHSGAADAVAFTGLDAEVEGKDEGCPVAKRGDRAVLRVLDPFAHEIGRGDSRVIAFEEVAQAGRWKPSVSGKLVLIGRQGRGFDRHESCDETGRCSDIGGLSLHVAAIDTLFKKTAIKVITPSAQLGGLAMLCLTVGWLRFVSAGRSRLRRFGEFGGLVVLDIALSIYLATHHALLVDTLHHLLAMAASYYAVSRIEPAH